MSPEKESTKVTNGNGSSSWWPWLKFIVPFVLFLLLVMTITRECDTVESMNENSEGENIQWLVDWMKSQEPQKKFNLRCEKEYDEASSQGWKLRCTTESEAENSKQSQWFSLRLDDPKGDQNQSGNSLCRRPCGHSTTPRCRTVISLKRYFQIYRWLFPKDSTGPDGIPKKHENGTVASGLDCKYESVTMSRQFEYESKRMLQQELRRLQENASFQKLSGPCQTKFKSELHEDFKTNFQNIFGEAFQEASALIKSTESAEVKLAHESPEGETTSQVKFTAEVEQREEQVSYSATSHMSSTTVSKGFQNDNLSSSS